MEHIIPYCLCLLVGVGDETKNGQIHCRERKEYKGHNTIIL